MKSKIKGTESEYPCLKSYGDKKEFYVVLFAAPDIGVVVFSAFPNFYVGDDGTANDATRWAEEQFTLFNGTIELSNN